MEERHQRSNSQVKPLMDIVNQEHSQRAVKIYMAYNYRAKGGNKIPLEVAIELAARELGLTTHEPTNQGID